MADNVLVGRFAPSPTGRMHAGNIFAALMSWLVVKSRGGEMVLRIEDLDVERSKPHFAELVMRDLEMLGLTWDRGPYYQQGRDEAYGLAFSELQRKGLLYPCFCTRADLKAASAPHLGEKNVYRGTCRGLSESEIAERRAIRLPAWRIEVPDERYVVDDMIQGAFSQNLASECGDYVVRRSDGLYAYQLASVVDDAEQGVNCIVRGVDLLPSTPQQRYLQDMLGFGHCAYAHVPLIMGRGGARRLSKRDHDAGLEELLAHYGSPEGVLGHIAFVAGIVAEDGPVTADELLYGFDGEHLGDLFPDKIRIQWR